MTPELAVRLLLDYVEQHFLSGLIALDQEIVDALRSCECSVEIEDDSLRVNGRLPSFFDAAWRAANEGGASLPSGLHWGRCYRHFVRGMNQLRIDGKLERLGFAEINLAGHRVQTQRIEISYP